MTPVLCRRVHLSVAIPSEKEGTQTSVQNEVNQSVLIMM